MDLDKVVQDLRMELLELKVTTLELQVEALKVKPPETDEIQNIMGKDLAMLEVRLNHQLGLIQGQAGELAQHNQKLLDQSRAIVDHTHILEVVNKESLALNKEVAAGFKALDHQIQTNLLVVLERATTEAKRATQNLQDKVAYQVLKIQALQDRILVLEIERQRKSTEYGLHSSGPLSRRGKKES